MTKVDSPSPSTDTEVMTTREAADRLGVSLKSVQHWCEDGALESWKTAGGHRRVLRSSVEALLRARGSHADASAGSAGSRSVSAAAGMTIYVVEDDPLYQKLYRTRLSAWNPPPRLLTFSSGYEALVRIGQEVPDLLITDVMMPGMNGLEMLHALQRLPECAGIEVIVVSVLSGPELARMGGVPAGVTVMGKPPVFEEIERIAQTLGRQ